MIALATLKNLQMCELHLEDIMKTEKAAASTLSLTISNIWREPCTTVPVSVTTDYLWSGGVESFSKWRKI